MIANKVQIATKKKLKIENDEEKSKAKNFYLNKVSKREPKNGMKSKKSRKNQSVPNKFKPNHDTIRRHKF